MAQTLAEMVFGLAMLLLNRRPGLCQTSAMGSYLGSFFQEGQALGFVSKDLHSSKKIWTAWVAELALGGASFLHKYTSLTVAWVPEQTVSEGIVSCLGTKLLEGEADEWGRWWREDETFPDIDDSFP